MQYKELKGKKKTELQKMLAEERGKQYDLQIKASVNQLSNVRALRKTKKDIARIMTAISALESEEKTQEAS